jgi:hypothetical protein
LTLSQSSTAVRKSCLKLDFAAPIKSNLENFKRHANSYRVLACIFHSARKVA